MAARRLKQQRSRSWPGRSAAAVSCSLLALLLLGSASRTAGWYHQLAATGWCLYDTHSALSPRFQALHQQGSIPDQSDGHNLRASFGTTHALPSYLPSSSCAALLIELAFGI